MDIQLQLCGLLMLLLLLLFYKSHRKLGLYSEEVFFRTLLITTLTVLFDILSVVFIYFSNSLPLLLVKIVSKTYLSFLICSAWATLTYILIDFSTKKVQIRITQILGIVSIAICITLYFLKLGIMHEDDIIYTYGAAVTTTYFVCAAFLLSSFVISLLLWRKTRSRRSFGGALLTFIWAGSAIVQFFFNNLLLVGFSQSLGMLILFVLMENPESYLDKEYDSFNVFGLKPFIMKLYETKRKFFVAQASIVNDEILTDAGHDVDGIIRYFISNISRQPNTYVFKDTSCSMTFISTDELSFNNCIKIVGQTKHELKFLKGYSKMVFLKNPEKLSGYSELLDIFAYTKSTYISKTTEYVEITQEIIERHKDENKIIKQIDDAIEGNCIEVYLQPIYSNKEKRFTTAEALARIRQKDGSLLSPGVFIPIAEKTGQVVSLGYQVLEKVIEFISSNNMEDLGLNSIEVNLSVLQCEQEDLFDKVMSMMKNHGASPHYINFEITESATINAKKVISANIQKLSDAGFTFSLDDFGKGESNLMYVVDMSVCQMKFDIDMTKAYFDSYKAKSIMKALIPMAHELDLRLVSEGVETEKELEILCGEGIDFIQGFYFSKPLPIPEFLEFIKSKISLSS